VLKPKLKLKLNVSLFEQCHLMHKVTTFQKLHKVINFPSL